MLTDAPIAHCILKILCRGGKFKDTEKVIRYHPFGIGTDIVFGISVPESTAGSTEIPEYRISVIFPSSGGNLFCNIGVRDVVHRPDGVVQSDIVD